MASKHRSAAHAAEHHQTREADCSGFLGGRRVRWVASHRFDSEVVPLADRHYNRQKVGSPQFAPPGRCHVLKIGTAEQFRTIDTGAAFWVTSWPFAEYVRHAWPGAWICSAFRNEGAGVSSELIREAIVSTAQKWPDIPDEGLISFIDPSKVNPRPIRGRKTWGHSWFEAGFHHVGYTKAGLWAFHMSRDRIAAIEL